MTREYEQPEGAISLHDQAFLKELGITGLESGLEHALRQYKAAMSAMDKIEKKADNLQSLSLDERTLAQLGRAKKLSPDKVRGNYQFFRDLEKGTAEDE